MMKAPEIYNIFDTEASLNRPVGVKINDKSGVAGVAFWLNQYLGLSGDQQLDKKHPAVTKIATWVEEQYRQGRTTAIASEEMVEHINTPLPEYGTEGTTDAIFVVVKRGLLRRSIPRDDVCCDCE